MAPLADRIRPQTIEDVVGQHHLLSEGKILRRIIDSGVIPNLIFYGPSGVGKTTVANIIAKSSGKSLYHLNATTASTADLKAIISSRNDIENQNGILLYLDEIQYFNKKQQQTLLEFIENGDITLIASTTENPYFYVYSAILSRSTVFEFKSLSEDDVIEFLEKTFKKLGDEQGKEVSLEEGVLKVIAGGSGGDLRKALNTTELCLLTANGDGDKISVTKQSALALTSQNAMRYDRNGDEHYDVISAFQKSMRGSDPDAALHYLARLLEAGDLPSACRRLLVTAAEDVGLAYPGIMPIVKSYVDTALMVGLPEAAIPLGDAVVLVAISPKSPTGHDGIAAALSDVRAGLAKTIPRHLQNKHFDGEDQAVKGHFYKYPHAYPNHYVEQQYLPDELKNKKYYKFGDNKTEQSFKAHMDKIKGK